MATAIAAAAVLLAGVAWLRWERPRELAPGVPLPPFARLVPDADLEPPPGDGCRATLHLREAPGNARGPWQAALEAAGWEAVGTEGGGARAVYRRGGTRMLVGIDAYPDAPGSRVRITWRPCPPELAGSDDARIVRAGG